MCVCLARESWVGFFFLKTALNNKAKGRGGHTGHRTPTRSRQTLVHGGRRQEKPSEKSVPVIITQGPAERNRAYRHIREIAEREEDFK